MKRILIAAGAAILATACATTEEDTVPAVAVGPMATPTDWSGYMQMAASGDMFEIESSRLAQQMSSNEAVRSFAQMLINDHTQLSNNLMATARSADLDPPPPQMLPHHMDMLQRLRAASPADFDMMFRQEQATAHQEALALHQTYAQSGDRAALRTVAAAAVPVIQRHMEHVNMLPSTPAPQPVQQPAPTYQPAPTTTPSPGERG